MMIKHLQESLHIFSGFCIVPPLGKEQNVPPRRNSPPECRPCTMSYSRFYHFSMQEVWEDVVYS